MSWIRSAKINGFDLYAYVKDMDTRLPSTRASLIQHLLPHCADTTSLDVDGNMSLRSALRFRSKGIWETQNV
jgi:hypothetical protein